MNNLPSHIKIREMERVLQRNFRAPWEKPLEKTIYDIHQEQVQLSVDMMFTALRDYKRDRGRYKDEPNLKTENLTRIVHAKKILECLGYHAAILGLDSTLAVRNDVWGRLMGELGFLTPFSPSNGGVK